MKDILDILAGAALYGTTGHVGRPQRPQVEDGRFSD
jgi:hypothetical protein